MCKFRYGESEREREREWAVELWCKRWQSLRVIRFACDKVFVMFMKFIVADVRLWLHFSFSCYCSTVCKMPTISLCFEMCAPLLPKCWHFDYFPPLYSAAQRKSFHRKCALIFLTLLLRCILELLLLFCCLWKTTEFSHSKYLYFYHLVISAVNDHWQRVQTAQNQE